jgi:hypothetical protein
VKASRSKSATKPLPPRRGPGGIEFNGESVKAKTDGKTLTVGGKDYGTLKSGDVVNLRAKGKILVNGVERSPVTP